MPQYVLRYCRLAFKTEYVPATNTKGSRIRCTDIDSGSSVTIPYPSELSGASVHRAALGQMMLKRDYPTADLTRIHYAEMGTGYVWLVPDRNEV